MCISRQIYLYQTDNGQCPFQEWLEALRDIKLRAIIRARLHRVELGNLGDCKSIGEGMFELRIFYGAGYRIYFGMLGASMVILLSGGDKSSQKKDIIRARVYWKEYLKCH